MGQKTVFFSRFSGAQILFDFGVVALSWTSKGGET
jgi:hypothetical protein